MTTQVGNLNRWSDWKTYREADLSLPRRMGGTASYRAGAEYLSDCATVEDWGCGLGGFRPFCKTAYLGVDGSETPHSDIHVDLTTYRSTCEGIFMRHVLEHNEPGEWQKVLAGACQSFTKKLFLVLFTPLAERTQPIGSGRPLISLSFRLEDITDILDEHDCGYTMEVLDPSSTQYKIEYLFRITRTPA